MEFCGSCGTELGRDLERGRFCAQCGHENPGNARYPLWADGAANSAQPVTAGAATATAVALPRVRDVDGDVTRVRMPAISMMASAAPADRPSEPVSTWRTTLVASLVTIAVVLLLGFLLLLH